MIRLIRHKKHQTSLENDNVYQLFPYVEGFSGTKICINFGSEHDIESERE